MSWLLIQDDPLYLKTIVAGGGKWVDMEWVEDSPVVGYTPFTGTWEPYQTGEDMIVLPDGVSSTDARIIYTEQELKTVDSVGGDSTLADIVYFKNPVTNPTTDAYRVVSKGDWELNASFQLMDSYGEYIVERVRAT